MIIYKEGDKSKGPCEKCQKIVSTTFRYAPLKYHDLTIPEVLQDFCDICGSPVSIPHQSSFRIREFRESLSHKVDFRVPPHYTDILVSIGITHNASPKPNFLCRILSELYLSKISKPHGKEVQERIIRALNDDLAKGKSKDRLSCVFPETTYSTLLAVAKNKNLKSASIIKGIIVLAKHDILDNKDRKLTKEFEAFAALRL